MPSSQADRLTGQAAQPRTANRFPLADLAAIAAGGAAGSVARYLAGDALTGLTNAKASGFPWPTFAVNVSGCFALGFLMIYLLDVWNPSRTIRLALTTGLLGGYTTFSTFTAALQHLISNRDIALADAYALTSLFAGLSAVWLGGLMARRLAAWRGQASRSGGGSGNNQETR